MSPRAVYGACFRPSGCPFAARRHISGSRSVTGCFPHGRAAMRRALAPMLHAAVGSGGWCGNW
ncbi:MAG: hypothetical protein JW832_11980, partial [Deltaproteobacteria bacterium]|nr:hypothetical protein [Deltaproteobacteria bacterium]